MSPVLSVQNLNKIYKGGKQALSDINLDVAKGEILALLGPNGAGKTTLISIICGIVNASNGKVLVGGFDNVKQFRQARSLIGLVPQELTTDAFETPWANLNFSRGLFGLPADPAKVEQVLRDLSLWDKKDNRLRQLSGGMKRRVLIAKALSHEPSILFLDEPTAGVDVELRKDMWKVVERLRESGVTIILTTHYIEEAEAIADRVAVINHGEIILVDKTNELLKKMGQKKLTIDLHEKTETIPEGLKNYDLELSKDKLSVTYIYDINERTGITNLLQDLRDNGLKMKDLKTEQSTLEKIFVNLVRKSNEN